MRMNLRSQTYIFLALEALFLFGAVCGAADDFDAVVRPFLAQHCERCHGEKKQKGEFRVDTLRRDFASPLTAAHWGDLMFRITSGEMPPEDEPKPKADEAAR